LAAAAVSGLVLLLPPSVGEHHRKPVAIVRVATPAAHVPPVVADSGWDRLSAVEQRTLDPLRGTWSTLTAEQQDKWRAIAHRVQGRPRHVQRRLAARIAEWASLSPEQRAHARLNYLELAKRYNTRQKKAQWQAYLSARPAQGRALTAVAPLRMVPPAFVQASPGATTVLLSQLYELPVTDDPVLREETVQDSAPIDEQRPQGTGAASTSAGSAVELERAAP